MRWSLSLLLLAAGCVDDRGPAAHLDVDAPPVTEGDWYRPTVDTRWQWQLSGAPINTAYDVEIYDVDLFDRQADVAAIQAAGFTVICYFSAGSSEDWREDFDRFDSCDTLRRLTPNASAVSSSVAP